MDLKKSLLQLQHIWFLLLLAVQFLPDASEGEYRTEFVIGFAVILEMLFVIVSFLINKIERVREIGKLLIVIESIFIVWTIYGVKLGKLNTMMFPAPGVVLSQYVEDIPALLSAIRVSLGSIGIGFFSALLTAVPLGLVLGWYHKIRFTASYTARFISAIPAIVYIPYAVAFLPNMTAARVFIIYLSSFWPILSGTMIGVTSIEKGILDSARTLNVKPVSLLTRVIFPGALPYIFNGIAQGLGISFVLLTSAEMISADTLNPGLGFYIWNYSNFAIYKRVIPGIVTLGVIICVFTFLIEKLQAYLLRWKPTA